MRVNAGILQKLSAISQEEQEILNGRRGIDRSLYMDGSRDVISGEKLLAKGKLIAIRPHTRFVAFPEHTHDYVEIVYMCQGHTRHQINGEDVLLQEGELLLLGQNARQSIEAAGERDIAVNFIVRPEFFAGTLSFLGDEQTPLRSFILYCLAGGSESGYLHFHVADVLPVQNLVENLLWTLISETPNKRGIHQMTMGLLFAQLLNCADRLTFSNSEEETVLRVLNYLEEHYRDGSLTEVAAALHYDISTLSNLIRRRTGKTYTELLQERRLSQAAWLLKNSDKRVEDISHSVGYENISYFHRLFLARFNCTPKHYRDKNKDSFL